jgi:hypothetical protein
LKDILKLFSKKQLEQIMEYELTKVQFVLILPLALFVFCMGYCMSYRIGMIEDIIYIV